MPTARDLIRIAMSVIEDADDFALAADTLEQAARLEPCARTLAIAALCRRKGRRPDPRAPAAARAAVELDPNCALAQNALGCALADEFRESDARRAFDRSLAIDPTSHATHFNRAVAAFHFGAYERAAGDFVRAILLSSPYVNPLRWSGIEWELTTADAVLRQIPALAADPAAGDADAVRVLIEVGRFIQDPDAYLLATTPRWRVGGALAWTPTALRYVSVRRARSRERVRRYLDRLVRECPKEPAFRWLRARDARPVHAPDPAAEADLDALVERFPTCPGLRESRADYRTVRGDPTRALADLDAWVGLAPDEMEPHCRRAYVLAELNRHAEALDDHNFVVERFGLAKPRRGGAITITRSPGVCTRSAPGAWRRWVGLPRPRTISTLPSNSTARPRRPPGPPVG